MRHARKTGARQRKFGFLLLQSSLDEVFNPRLRRGKRKQMKQAGGTVKVAKNRLAKLALKETDNADISALFTGPTVVAFAQDPMVAPKVAAAFADKNQKFVVLGGAMGKTGLDANNVKALATMPSLDQLRATLAGMLKQPGTRIASILQAPGGAVARVISAHAEKGNEA